MKKREDEGEGDEGEGEEGEVALMGEVGEAPEVIVFNSLGQKVSAHI